MTSNAATLLYREYSELRTRRRTPCSNVGIVGRGGGDHGNINVGTVWGQGDPGGVIIAACPSQGCLNPDTTTSNKMLVLGPAWAASQIPDCTHNLHPPFYDLQPRSTKIYSQSNPQSLVVTLYSSITSS